jgi:P27 family predicted phage terminase small subunit
MRGRKPDPPALKVLKGTRPSRMPATASPVADTAECPDWLDDVARAKWGRMVAAFVPLTTATAEALAIYCDAYSRLQLARAAVAEHGLSIHTGQGGLKTNPAANVARDAHSTMIRVLADLARAPAAAPEAEVDELAAFLA